MTIPLPDPHIEPSSQEISDANLNALMRSWRGVKQNFDKLASYFPLTSVGLDSGLADYLGISSPSTVRRGKSIIDATEGYTSAAWGTMATPDQVSSVVMPADGILWVAFRAEVSATNGGGGVGLYVGGTLVTNQDNTINVQIDPWDGVANNFKTIWSDPNYGIAGSSTVSAAVPNNQIAAVPIAIALAAGTYDVNLQYVNNSGPNPGVQARYRRLWVKTEAF